MAPSHLCRMLACATLLLAACQVSANPAQGFAKDSIRQNSEPCPVVVRVGKGHGLATVALQDTLEFSLNPNMPLMSMNFLGDDVLYKATVDGTMVTLFQCDVQDSNCIIVEEGGTKSKNLLEPNTWNQILVKYNNGEISVEVNTRTRVMGGHMTMNKGPSKSGGDFHLGGGKVTFMVPPNTPSYVATLKIICSAEPPHVQTELPVLPPSTAATTSKPSMLVKPYETCPLYKLETNHPSDPALLNDHLTLAVFPNSPAIQLLITNDRLYLKVHVDGSRAELLRCEAPGKNCFSKDEHRISQSYIVPEKWNFVTISLVKEEIKISINETKLVQTASLQFLAHQNDLRVIAMAPHVAGQEHFVALVNVECEGSEHKTTWPATPTSTSIPTLNPTQKGLLTKDPIVDSTPEPSTSGISRNVGIVVGVLVGVLLIIALAIIISTVKKRRSTVINDQSPLQNQHQQQD